MIELSYEPDGATLTNFLFDASRVRLIQGPRGSGKSNLCCYTLLHEALQQPKGFDGVRRSRTYVIRRTFDELKRTTVKTWLQNFPEDKFGRFIWSRPFEHHIRVGDLDWEVIFLSLDDPSDLQKLKSAEISSAWVNEFAEISRDVLDDLEPCLGRYPDKKMMDGGCRRPFLIADTNPGSELHWFSVMSGQSAVPSGTTEDKRRVYTKPPTWSIFIQPPGMFEQFDSDGKVTGYITNPKAENLKWLPRGYYENMVHGKQRSWVRRNCCNKPASEEAGSPVWPEFQEHIHVAAKPLQAIEGHTLMIGVDFGRTPAAVIAQRVFDRWRILNELTAQDCGAREFARRLKRLIAEEYPGFSFKAWGDPAGEHLAEADDISPMLMFRAEGVQIYPAGTNDPVVRTGAVREVLTRLVDAVPQFSLSPSCVFLKASMSGGYMYPERKGSEVISPLKNQHSHIADALQYLMIGGGEGRALLSKGGPPMKVRTMPKPKGIFQRYARRR